MRFKDGIESLNTLDLYNYRFFDNQVQPIKTDLLPFVNDREGGLALLSQPGSFKFDT